MSFLPTAMKMVWFFIISALIHSLIFALPAFHDKEGQGNAIPVTLVLAPQKAAPEKTLSNAVTKPMTQESVAKKRIKPKITIKKPTKKRATKKPIVKKKLAKARRPKPSKTPEKKKPITIAARPKDVQKVQTESPPEREDTFSHLEIEEFLTSQPLKRDPADGPTMKMAKVKLRSKPETKPLTRYLKENNLQETSKGVNFLGESNKASLFVGVKYARIAKPRYPSHARKMGWEGTTLLRVLVNQKGETKLIEISRSSGFTALDKAAIKAVKRWRFHPARSGEKSVESWVKIPIVFDLEELKRD